MPHPIDQPFPTPNNQPLETQIGVLAMGEYLRVFEQRRNERPYRQFADVDITEFMRRAENLDKVAEIEMKFISSELLRKRPALFRHEAQKALQDFQQQSQVEKCDVQGRRPRRVDPAYSAHLVLPQR